MIHCILDTVDQTPSFGDDLIRSVSTTDLPIIYISPILGIQVRNVDMVAEHKSLEMKLLKPLLHTISTLGINQPTPGVKVFSTHLSLSLRLLETLKVHILEVISESLSSRSSRNLPKTNSGSSPKNCVYFRVSMPKSIHNTLLYTFNHYNVERCARECVSVFSLVSSRIKFPSMAVIYRKRLQT